MRTLAVLATVALAVTVGVSAVGDAQPSTSVYFAEGTVRPGFVQYLAIFNPNDAASRAVVTFQAAGPGGDVVPVPPMPVEIGARARVTRSIGDHLADAGIDVARGVDVAMVVRADQPVVAERSMYFRSTILGEPAVDGGSVSLGATELARVHHFADGSTRDDVRTFLALQNPEPIVATVDIRFAPTLVEGADPPAALPPIQLQLGAQSRSTVDISTALADAGPRDFAIRVEATQPIVAERTMFFRTGLLGGVDGAITVAGVDEPSRRAYLPAGAVRPEVATFLSVYNPGTEAANVAIALTASADDREPPVALPPLNLTVPSQSRISRDVRTAIQGAPGLEGDAALDISYDVQASQPVVVERTTFLRSGLLGGVEGGVAVTAAPELGRDHFFAEGAVRPGFMTLLHLFNPGAEPATVMVELAGVAADGSPVAIPAFDIQVPAGGRSTEELASRLDRPGPLDVAMALRSDQPVVAARTMLFRAALGPGNLSGATAVIGARGHPEDDGLPAWLPILGGVVLAVAVVAVAVTIFRRRWASFKPTSVD